jgi:uncharacterized protein
MFGKRKVLASIVILLLLAAGVFMLNGSNLLNAANVTTTAPTSGENIVSTQGEGVIRVVPDVAYVTLGVETSNKDMSAAQAANRSTMNAVMSELTRLGISKDDVQTQSYNVYPEHSWENNKSTLIGYKVSNLVRVKISNIDITGTILDAVAAKGANSVQGIQFTVSDENQAYQEALLIALKKAEDKAKSLVGYFGITKLTPVAISEGTAHISYPPIMQKRVDAEMAADSTSVSPGEMEIRAQVSVSFRY